MDLKGMAFWSIGGIQRRIYLFFIFFLCLWILLKCMFDARTCDLSVLKIDMFI